MRIRSLKVKNLRAIERFEISGLSDFILIAGPNGCGKTTVLDAIRLAKSSYVPDEWKKWFSEFGVNVDRPTNWATLFRDPSRPATIEAEFALSAGERDFLLSAALDISLAINLATLPDRRGASSTVTGDPPILPPTLTTSQQQNLTKASHKASKALIASLRKDVTFRVGVSLAPKPGIQVLPSPVATAAFTCFNPENLGEVEFHTSRRLYARESVENIRLKVVSRSEERRSRFLYDLENKYRNIKTQLGEEYVASILHGTDPDLAPLQRSIKELFRTFFPGKQFLGVHVAADNALAFPVQLDTGESHDIDELSSGEKEIVYGYLWLRTGTPKRSVVLVDEPELHLNPALVQGLPSFYQANLAIALDAQVWIVTHSDAILRQSVRASNMTVFHMARPVGDGSNQARQSDSQDAVEAAVLDLIGDIGAYRPHARIVLVEGHTDTRFDVDMIRRLFPDFAERANLIPVGNRAMTTGVRVRLLEVLKDSGLAGRAVSICDGDLGLTPPSPQTGQYIWPAYEIENFLLVPAVLRAASMLLLRSDPFGSDKKVISTLRMLATPLVQALARDEAQYVLNREFVAALSVKGGTKTPAQDLASSANASQARVAAIDASAKRVEVLFAQAAKRIRASLKNEQFLLRLPGDRLLRALAGHLGIAGDHFRNACLDQARRLGLRPKGMEDILRKAIE